MVYLAYFAGLVLIFAISYDSIFDSKLSLSGDNANYYILAKNLASNNEFTTGHGVHATPHNHFPPGYPFLMSLFHRAGISSVWAMKVLNGFFLLCSSFLMFQIVRRISKNTFLSFALAGMLLINAHLLEYSSIIMSEISFLTFTLLSIYLYLVWREKDFKWKSIYFFLLLIALITTLYIRSLGISLLLAFLIDLSFKKRFLSAGIILAVCILTQLPWQVRSNNLGGNSYMKQVFSVNPYDKTEGKMHFENWVERVKLNAVRYASKEIPLALFPGLEVKYKNPATAKIIPSPYSHWILGFLIILFTTIGIWSLKEFRVLFLAMFSATVGILLLWPDVWFGVRFFIPLIPFSFLFFFLGIVFIIQKLFAFKSSPLRSPKLSLFVIPLVFFQIKPLQKLQKKSEQSYPKNWENYFTMGTWCSDNLPENSFVACRKPGLFYCSGDTEAATFLSSTNRKEFLDHLDKNQFTHVVAEQLGFSQTGKYLYPVLKSEPEKFKLIHQIDAEALKGANGTKIQPRTGVWLFEYVPEFGYQGSYRNGKRHGKGIYKYRSGGHVQGNWRNDTLQGPGEMKDAKGRYYRGSWVDGKRQGVFIIQEENRTIESLWINDTIQSIGYVLDAKGNRMNKIRLK